MNTDGWKKLEEWLKREKDFTVVVKHWTEEEFDTREGPHRWGVYAFIYPSHQHFKKLTGDNIFHAGAQEIPIHGGPSRFCRHWDSAGANVTSVEIGADYHHDGDRHYTFNDTGEAVLFDADKLVRWLSDYESKGKGQDERN